MVETLRIPPPPKRENDEGIRWRISGPPALPSPFETDYVWQFIRFNLNFEVYKCPPGIITFEVDSLNQLVAFQLPSPIKVRKKRFALKKEKTTISRYMVIQQAFTRPSTKFAFRCIYRRKWALEEGIDRAILNYRITIRREKEARVSGPHQIVIPLVRRDKESTKPD